MSLPRLLAGVDRAEAVSFDDHVAVHGELPRPVSRRRQGAPALVEHVRLSGLRGRGGAGFPVARKIAAVLAARGRPIVVVNGCEGEPASDKDRLLLERSPHLVIDGALACARALGTDEILFAVDADAPSARWAVQAALAARPDVGRDGLEAAIVTIPRGYVSGQESAIVNFVNRGVAKPTAVPPMVFERGVGRRPTLVSNAETVAQIALIERHGADWFREIGTPDQPGSALVTLSGAVAEPGVFEIEYGAVLDSLIGAAGGALSPIRAVLFGGYGGTWVDGPRAVRLALDSELARRGRGGARARGHSPPPRRRRAPLPRPFASRGGSPARAPTSVVHAATGWRRLPEPWPTWRTARGARTPSCASHDGPGWSPGGELAPTPTASPGSCPPRLPCSPTSSQITLTTAAARGAPGVRCFDSPDRLALAG